MVHRIKHSLGTARPVMFIRTFNHFGPRRGLRATAVRARDGRRSSCQTAEKLIGCRDTLTQRQSALMHTLNALRPIVSLPAFIFQSIKHGRLHARHPSDRLRATAGDA